LQALSPFASFELYLTCLAGFETAFFCLSGTRRVSLFCFCGNVRHLWTQILVKFARRSHFPHELFISFFSADTSLLFPPVLSFHHPVLPFRQLGLVTLFNYFSFLSQKQWLSPCQDRPNLVLPSFDLRCQVGFAPFSRKWNYRDFPRP